jgi:3-hydroxyacyl-[acyl-carrier-protein] dehydratase
MSALHKALQAAASPLESLPETNRWQRQYMFDASSAVFAGHFPQYPILPGVVQILMAQMTLEEALGKSLRLSAIPQAKFTALLEPDTVIELQIKMGRRADLWECSLHRAGHAASYFQLEVITSC